MTTKKRTQLTEEHRTWLVTAYACYGRRCEVLRDFRDTFGFEIDKFYAYKYDLSGFDEAKAKATGRAKWLPLFRKVRAEFEASIGDIPIASATYRVKKIDQMFEIAFEKRNYKSAALLLEQAAKEIGGMYTNRRVMAGSIEHNHTVEEVPMDVKRSAVAQSVMEALADAMAARSAQADTAPPPKTTH